MSAPAVLPTAGFTIIPNEILLNPSVSIEAKSTLTLLKYFDRGTGRGCFARKETLCRFLSVSPYRLRKALQELKDLGLIMITKRGQGNPDLIHVVPQEEPLEPEQIQVEVEGEMQEELDHVAEEPLEESHIPEVNDVEIQTGEILSAQHYKEKNKEKKISNTLQCDEDELITYFFLKKEDRKPTQNVLTNWRPTASRLLSEFSLDELKPATDYAIDQGARLFYFVALVAPDFIIKYRHQKEIESERLKHAEKAIEAQNEKAHQLLTIKENSREFEGVTKDLHQRLYQKMRPQCFNVWFKNTFISAADEDSISLCVESETIAQWIMENYLELVSEVAGRSVEVICV